MVHLNRCKKFHGFSFSEVPCEPDNSDPGMSGEESDQLIQEQNHLPANTDSNTVPHVLRRSNRLRRKPVEKDFIYYDPDVPFDVELAE